MRLDWRSAMLWRRANQDDQLAVCLIVVAFRADSRWPVLVLANRDEFHARPAAPLAIWNGGRIAAGRDLQAGGTWMGVLADGSFAAVTNARTPGGPRARPRSRGSIPTAALAGLANGQSASAALSFLQCPEDYAPFGLLIADQQALHHRSNWFSSEGGLDAGIHALSNGAMNARWPKAEQLCRGLRQQLSSGEVEFEALFALLREERVDPMLPLPDTGVGIELERRLAPPFIRDPVYGTRASTILRVSADGAVDLCERSFDAAGNVSGQQHLRAEGGFWRESVSCDRR